MKKVLAICAFLSVYSLSMAQVTLDELQKVQQLWGKGKQALTTELLNLQPDQQAAFNKVFDGYLADRQKLGQERIALIDDYAKSFNGIDAAKSKFLAKGFLKNDSKLNKLHKKYFNKLSKALNPTQAAQWLQLEKYIDNAVRSEMQELIPFIKPGQLKKVK